MLRHVLHGSALYLGHGSGESLKETRAVSVAFLTFRPWMDKTLSIGLTRHSSASNWPTRIILGLKLILRELSNWRRTFYLSGRDRWGKFYVFLSFAPSPPASPNLKDKWHTIMVGSNGDKRWNFCANFCKRFPNDAGRGEVCIFLKMPSFGEARMYQVHHTSPNCLRWSNFFTF